MFCAIQLAPAPSGPVPIGVWRRLMDEHLTFLRVNYQPAINSTEGFDRPKPLRQAGTH